MLYFLLRVTIIKAPKFNIGAFLSELCALKDWVSPQLTHPPDTHQSHPHNTKEMGKLYHHQLNLHMHGTGYGYKFQI